ncbi:MAG: signal peptidase I [Clostridiales bacterium]|jgi:signal peptidase|nr:signal peptidase I [Clostridiales bacterium]
MDKQNKGQQAEAMGQLLFFPEKPLEDAAPTLAFPEESASRGNFEPFAQQPMKSGSHLPPADPVATSQSSAEPVNKASQSDGSPGQSQQIQWIPLNALQGLQQGGLLYLPQGVSPQALPIQATSSAQFFIAPSNPGQVVCIVPSGQLPLVISALSTQPAPQVDVQSKASVDNRSGVAASEPQKSKPLSSALNAISTVVTVILVALAVLAICSTVAGKNEYGLAIGPFRLLNVLTGSMAPEIAQGSLIVEIEPKEHELNKGDIITFTMPEGTGELVTHRITKVGPEPHMYLTKGDANRVTDPPIPFKNIVGKHVFTIPFLGLVLSSLSSPLSAVWLISVAILLMLLVWILKKIFQDR